MEQGGEELPRLSPGVGCESAALGDKVTDTYYSVEPLAYVVIDEYSAGNSFVKALYGVNQFVADMQHALVKCRIEVNENMV